MQGPEKGAQMQRVTGWPQASWGAAGGEQQPPRRHSPRAPPSTGMSNHEAFVRVDSGYRMPCPLECPPSVHKLMLSCWHRDPEKRPGFKALREKLSSFTRYENPT